MKIAVLGNCQSRPVATFLAALCPEVVVLPEIVTQLQKPECINDNYRVLSEADVIFAQFVTDTYPVRHLSTSTLKTEFQDKLISWPNVFFTGQCPDVVSVSTDQNQRVIGPLDTYHLRSIYLSWQKSQSPHECFELLMNGDITETTPSIQSSVSMTELKKREMTLDVPISDYIEERWTTDRLFHVFNHPTNSLLIELVSRMARYADLKTDGELLPEFWAESLNRVIVPTLPPTKAQLGLTYRSSTNSKGFSLKTDEQSHLALGSVQILSLSQLVKSFFHAYDIQLSKTDSLTFTPAYLNLRKPA